MDNLNRHEVVALEPEYYHTINSFRCVGEDYADIKVSSFIATRGNGPTSMLRTDFTWREEGKCNSNIIIESINISKYGSIRTR